MTTHKEYIKQNFIATLSWSKELIVFSRYAGMSARKSEPPAFCRTRFKSWIAASATCNIKVVAKNILDDISWKYQVHLVLLFHSHELKVVIIFVYSHSKDFSILCHGQSNLLHLGLLGSHEILHTLLQHFSRNQRQEGDNGRTSITLTTLHQQKNRFNRCSKQRATLWFPQPTQLQ